MNEYLICTPDYAKKTRFIPAHLIYKIENGHLFRQQIPISLNGGVMVIGSICGALNIALAKRILTECLRFNFSGVFLALPPLPEDASLDFARELCDLLVSKNIKLFLPLTYSACNSAMLLVPAINTSSSFHNYLEDVCIRYSPERLVLELSTQPIEFKIPQKEPNFGVPISFEQLKELIHGAMTFYSHDLCTNYFTYDSSFIVFDTPETFAVKRKIAESFGINSCFYLVNLKNTAILEKLEQTR